MSMTHCRTGKSKQLILFLIRVSPTVSSSHSPSQIFAIIVKKHTPIASPTGWLSYPRLAKTPLHKPNLASQKSLATHAEAPPSSSRSPAAVAVGCTVAIRCRRPRGCRCCHRPSSASAIGGMTRATGRLDGEGGTRKAGKAPEGPGHCLPCRAGSLAAA